jgi:hypothetical protein
MYLSKFFQSFFCSFEFLFSVLDFKDQTVQLLLVLVFTLFTEKKFDLTKDCLKLWMYFIRKKTK